MLCCIPSVIVAQASGENHSSNDRSVWIGPSGDKLPEIKDDIEKLRTTVETGYKIRSESDPTFPRSVEGTKARQIIDSLHRTEDVIEDNLTPKSEQPPSKRKQEREKIARKLESNPDLRIAYYRPCVNTRMQCGGDWQFASYKGLPIDWSTLCAPSDRLREIARAVGMVSARCFANPNERKNIGTAFLVAPDIIMTNKHVIFDHVAPIASFLNDSTNVQLRDTAEAEIDFAAEDCPEHDGSKTLRIVKVVAVLPFSDIALVRLEHEVSFAKPVVFRKTSPDPSVKNYVVAIGFPATPNADDEERTEMFIGGKLGSRRVSPGILVFPKTSNPGELRHDCTTLHGSSGSPIVGLEDGNVIGIHFREDSAPYDKREGNYAAAATAFRNDPTLEASGASLKWSD